MNYGIIRFLIGKFLTATGVTMIAPILVALWYREPLICIFSYAIPMSLMILIGIVASNKPTDRTAYFAREGLVMVALGWTLVSFFGAFPYIIQHINISFFDAFFESCSSFSTTGASVFVDDSFFPKSLLFWRTFSLFLGGIGMLIVVVLAMPTSGSSGVFIMRAELPGPKITSRNVTSVRIYYVIYVSLTLACIFSIKLFDVPFFESMLLGFSIAGTGGFNVSQIPLTEYPNQTIIPIMAIFMFLFGMSFGIYYLIFTGKFEKILRNEEFRWYIGIVFVATLFIVVNLYPRYNSLSRLIRDAFFTVTSTISTTSYTCTDIIKWPVLSQSVLLFLSFSGAMSGSTTGALKVYRVAVYIKTFLRELKLAVYPNRNIAIRLDDVKIPDKTLSSIHKYLVTYTVVFATILFLVSFSAPNFSTAFSAVVATLNNTGHGLDLFGTASDYSVFSNFAKIVFSFAMLAGRLEIYPILILFFPPTYQKG